MNKKILRSALNAVIVAGITIALWPLGQTAYSQWSQHRLRTQWDEAQQENAHQPKPQKKPPTSKPPAIAAAPKWPITRLVVPDAGVDAVVLDGWDEATLKQGPGHLKTSALPGQKGNCVIAGHRNVYGSPFYNIDGLNLGNVIELHTPDCTYTYSVLSVSAAMETDQTVLGPPQDPNAEPRLTLVTCTIPRTSSRVIVEAYLTGVS